MNHVHKLVYLKGDEILKEVRNETNAASKAKTTKEPISVESMSN